MSSELFGQYSRFEDGLISDCNNHPLHRDFLRMDPYDFRNYVLQLGFFAQNFVQLNEMAKHGLSETTKEVIRIILRDEIPQQGPTHQDDRLHDLNLIGITTERFRCTKPHWKTRQAIMQLYDLFRYPQADYELRALVALRVAGEIIVAEQFRHIVNYMQVRLGIPPGVSRFYEPHFKHDVKRKVGSTHTGHTEVYDDILEHLITDSRTLGIAINTARAACKIRMSVCSQFLPKSATRVAVRMATATAVGASTLIALSSMIQTASTLTYAQFIANLEPEARVFYLEHDRKLLERIQRSGETHLLRAVGTFESSKIMWGEGP